MEPQVGFCGLFVVGISEISSIKLGEMIQFEEYVSDGWIQFEEYVSFFFCHVSLPEGKAFSWKANHGSVCFFWGGGFGQLMVNCWFGNRWFGFLGTSH